MTIADGGWLKAESELDSARQALAAVKEAFQRAEEENSSSTDERLSILMELGAIKEDFTTFRAKSSAEKSALEAEFDASSDVIFGYGYGCCAFMHDIRGSKLIIMSPRCPPGSSSVLLAAEPVDTTGEDLPIKYLPTAEKGVDIPPKPID